MTRFAITSAIAVFVALGSVAANATDIRSDGIVNPGASVRADANPRGKHAVRAGDVYSAQELMVTGLNESDFLEFSPRDTFQVRADDVYTAQDLMAVGLNANDVLTVSNFSANGQIQRRAFPGDQVSQH